MPTVNGPDEITTLEGGNNKVFYSNNSGEITELALGASGTVLTSAGTDATANPPTWEVSSSGGVYSTTTHSTSTAITAGDVCVMMSDGTVAEVTTSYSGGLTLGTDTAGSSTLGYVPQGWGSWCEDNLGNIWVVSGDGTGAAGIYLTAMTITASGSTTTVTWGTPYNISTSAAYGAQISWDASAERIVITWTDSSNWIAEHATPTGTGASATISATSGTYIFETTWPGTYPHVQDYVPAYNGTAVLFSGHTWGYGIASQTLFVDTSGTFTTGTRTSFYSESSATIGGGYWDATNSLFFVVYGNSNGTTKAMTGTYSGSGSTLSLAIRGGTTNTSTVYVTGTTQSQAYTTSVTHIEHLDRALVMLTFDTSTSSEEQQIQLWDPNAGGNYIPDYKDRMEQYMLNDTQYLWSQTDPAGTASFYNRQLPIAYDATNDETYMVYSSNDATGAVNKWILDHLAVTATTVDRATSTSFVVTDYTYNTGYGAMQWVHHAAAANARNSAIVVFGLSSNAQNAQGVFLGQASVNDAAWVGIAKNSTSGAGQAIDVYVLGGVSDVQTGLTVGADYYAQSDGSIGTTVTSTDKFVGRALTATKLLVENTGVGTG